MPRIDLCSVLEELAIPSHDATVFFHINSRSLEPKVGRGDVFAALDRYFASSSTVCLPSYPFPGNSYWDYLQSNPVFDVLQTPSRVSIIAELFRRRPAVVRSLHPWLSAAAIGPNSEHLLSEHHLDVDPLGDFSPYERMRKCGGIVVGLGCDCNTNMFIHLADREMSDRLPFNLYEPATVKICCINQEKENVLVETKVLHRSVGKYIKPRLMKADLSSETFYRELNRDTVPFYAMTIDDFVNYTVEANRRSIPPSGLPLHYASQPAAIE